MNTRDILRIQENSPLLAVYDIENGITELQTLATELEDRTAGQALNAALERLAARHVALRTAISQGRDMLLEVNHGLQGLVTLLDVCDGQRLDGKDLACLLQPQQRKLMRAVEHACQVL